MVVVKYPLEVVPLVMVAVGNGHAFKCPSSSAEIDWKAVEVDDNDGKTSFFVGIADKTKEEAAGDCENDFASAATADVNNEELLPTRVSTPTLLAIAV